jgi:nitroimidazol reductase NimA-like FMN-containing flavoprotein (pyridoxamine 5'-phosphate oxidase superfamily)
MTVMIKSGPWDVATTTLWLQNTIIPIRLASSGKQGPLVQSLWFEFKDGAIWCATQRDSAVAKRVAKHPVIGWEVSPDQPPYRGARGRGSIEVIEDSQEAGEVLRRLIHRYGQSGTELETWLMSRVSTEVAFRITELEVATWDFSPRMDTPQ